MHFKEKINNLLIFSLVPISQLAFFLSVKDNQKLSSSLQEVQFNMYLSNNQMIVMTLFAVLIYSVIIYFILYLVYSLLLKISKKRNLNALNMSLILSIGISNGISILCNELKINNHALVIPILGTVIFSYFYFSISKDKIGGLVITISAVIINLIIPLFLNVYI